MSRLFRNQMSMTTSLLLSNIIVFLLGGILQVPAFFNIGFPAGPMESLLMVRGSYSWMTCFMDGEIWRLITYQFLHAGGLHLAFNMWALYFFGPAVENVMGPRRFLLFYLCCGIAGALFSSLLACLGFFSQVDSVAQLQILQELAHYTDHPDLHYWQLVPMVGASAAIYGLLIAVAFLYPHSVVQLVFPPVRMTMRTFALVTLAIAVFVISVNGHNAGGEAGHLGGIIFSDIVMSIWRYLYLKKRRDEGRF